MSTEEGFICRTGCHWAVFFGPGVVLAIGGLMVASRAPATIAVVAFGLVWSILSYVGYKKSVMGLTRNRLAIHAGFPLPRHQNIPLAQIESIKFYQPALGALLDFGKVVVSDGKHSLAIRFVSSPAAFVAEVRRRMGSAVDLEEVGGD